MNFTPLIRPAISALILLSWIHVQSLGVIGGLSATVSSKTPRLCS